MSEETKELINSRHAEAEEAKLATLSEELKSKLNMHEFDVSVIKIE